MAFTNYNNVPLPVAIWLATSNYDYNHDPSVISATSLLNPTKSLILSQRLVDQGMASETEVLDLLPSRLGSAIHDSVEFAVTNKYAKAMESLGIPEKVIDTISINPEEPTGGYDIYLERRSYRELGNWKISGKFDIVEEGRVKDIKTTKTYNWIKGSNDEKYRKQGSIYRWLNQDIITDDCMDVIMLFTDWSPLQAMASSDYPPNPVMVRTLPLLSLEETERFITAKLEELQYYWDEEQDAIPRCTPEELWQDPTTYAWYKQDPSKAKRASKVFDNSADAYRHQAENGGHVVTRPGQVKFCSYCDARSACLQAQEYVQQGLLKV